MERNNSEPEGTGREPGDGEDRTHATAGVRELRHPIWLHPSVSDDVRGWKHLYARLGIVLTQLAAEGRTSITKRCNAPNRGWQRAPLGGHGGMQWYLWWTPTASVQGEALKISGRGILVRSVRHHDDHRELRAGPADDYLPLTRGDELTADVAGEPWTPAQDAFATSASRTRLLMGTPGSGKTSALWRAVNVHNDERVLYVTWSQALARETHNFFESFGPSRSEIIAIDIATLLGRINTSDPVRQTLAESRARLAKAMSRLSHQTTGPWRTRTDALHAELRAALYGAATGNGRSEARVRRIDDRDYMTARAGREAVGARAARAATKIAASLDEAAGAIFPELAAATSASRNLAAGRLPEALRRIDRLVIDEVQDLTLSELDTLTELAIAMGRARGEAPAMLLAGDAGQTVRPTGFEWGRTAQLLAGRLARPTSFRLNEHVRCPERIAETVDRAAELYTRVDKTHRPRKQTIHGGGQHVEAVRMHVAAKSTPEANALIEALAQSDGTAVITATAERPAWLSETARKAVLTPAETKGLEYQRVCVLGAGSVVREIKAGEGDGDTGLEAQARRSAIDHLRVALSRATETLALIDVGDDPEGASESRWLLGESPAYEPADLIEELSASGDGLDERVGRRADAARQLAERSPERAWQLACQAFDKLGEPTRPNAVSDQPTRESVRRTMLEIGCRRVLGGEPGKAGGADTLARLEEGAEAAERATAETERLAVDALRKWQAAPTQAALELAEATALLDAAGGGGGDAWTTAGVATAAQRIEQAIEKGAGSEQLAARYQPGRAEQWLRAIGATHKAASRGRELEAQAAETLVAAAEREHEPEARERRLGEAAAIAEASGGKASLRAAARIKELAGDGEGAAAAYLESGARDEAIRALRDAGETSQAAALSDGELRRDLTWLTELEAHAATAGQSLRTRMSETERAAINALLERAEAGETTPRRTGEAEQDPYLAITEGAPPELAARLRRMADMRDACNWLDGNPAANDTAGLDAASERIALTKTGTDAAGRRWIVYDGKRYHAGETSKLETYEGVRSNLDDGVHLRSGIERQRGALSGRRELVGRLVRWSAETETTYHGLWEMAERQATLRLRGVYRRRSATDPGHEGSAASDLGEPITLTPAAHRLLSRASMTK